LLPGRIDLARQIQILSSAGQRRIAGTILELNRHLASHRETNMPGADSHSAAIPQPSTWRKLTPEPLLVRGEDDEWDADSSAPFVMQSGDGLRMYYHGRQNDRIRIGFAEASVDDPLAWTKHAGNPVLDLGEPGTFDCGWVGYPWIVPVTDAHWHLYYAAWDGTFRPPHAKNWTTGMAESDDAGLSWRRTGDSPLIEVGQRGSPHESATGSCAVVPVGDEYWMYYTAISDDRSWPPHGLRISCALAVSADGGHTFEPHPMGAVVHPDRRDPMASFCCSKPVVYHEDGVFRMWYNSAGETTYRVRYAESVDGMHFSVAPDAVIPTSSDGWDSEMTCYVSRLALPDRTLLYYCGNGYAGIGAAELEAIE